MRRLAPASSVRECSRRERESGSRARGPGRDRLARDAAAARPVAPPDQPRPDPRRRRRSEEHTSELQSQSNLVCRLLLEKKKKKTQDKLCDRSYIKISKHSHISEPDLSYTRATRSSRGSAMRRESWSVCTTASHRDRVTR